jgi:hypothetical protein
MALIAASNGASSSATMAEAQRLQADAAEAMNTLRRKEAEFAIREQMLNPILSAAEHDREAALSLRKQAENILLNAQVCFPALTL